MKLKYFKDSETYEGLDTKSGEYLIIREWEPEEAQEEYEIKIHEEAMASIKVVGDDLRYTLTSNEGYNDGDYVEHVSFPLASLNRYLTLIGVK